MPELKKNRQARPTMQAVADPGVSRATVSLILANRQGLVDRFKPETVAKVRECAEELGYRANIMALSLRAPHPAFFGLILRGPGTAHPVSWHHQAFEAEFLAGALEASRVLGLYPVLATQDSPDPEAAIGRVRGVLDGGVFGAILRSPRRELVKAIQRQIEKQLPVVVVFPEDHAAITSNCIDVDNVAAGRLAADLLQKAHRRRLLLIQDEVTWEATRLRNEGFMSMARLGGAQIQALTVPGGTESTEVQSWLAQRLADIRPDGVYAAASVTGVETLMACQAAGLKVPKQTALVGSDAALWCAPGLPAITSVDISWHKVGELAVRKMVELQEKEEWTFANVDLPPEVRAGGTCPVAEG